MTPLVLALLLTLPDAGPGPLRPVVVSADRLELAPRELRAVYRGHARAVRDGTTLTCEEIEVFFTPAREVERIVARGGVLAVDGDREARGDEAEYDNRLGVLTVRGAPRARQGPREVLGDLVTFTTGLERLVVTRARTRVDGPDDQRLAIDADELVLEGAKQEATWRGHVRATRAHAVLTAPELVATYDDAGRVTRARARGGVEVTEGDRWARGQAADYDVPRGVLVVTGRPQARQGASRMKGSKVTLYTGTELLEVEDAVTVIETGRAKAE